MNILARFIQRTHDPKFDHGSSEYLLDLAVVAAHNGSEEEVEVDIIHYGDARVREALKNYKNKDNEIKRLRQILEVHEIPF